MQNPFIITVLAPLAFSLLLWVVALLCLRGEMARAVAGSAAGVSFLIVAVLVLGWPLFPPVTATHKSMVLAMLAVGLGFALHASHATATIVRVMFLLLWAAGLAWLAQRVLFGERWWQVALTCVAGIAVLLQVERRAGDGLLGVGQILLCAVGLSMIALLSSSASIAQSAGALAAACGGVMLVNWPRVRLPISASTLFPIALILGLLAAQTVLFTQARIVPIVMLMLVFAVPRLIDRVLGHRDLVREVWAPVLLIVIGSVPVVAAVLLLRSMGEQTFSY